MRTRPKGRPRSNQSANPWFAVLESRREKVYGRLTTILGYYEARAARNREKYLPRWKPTLRRVIPKTKR